ncbi:hypothetical protein H0H81_002583 [Sphagnurus paluster]|uniref:Uncharacterized protein n=1 Tax=Sphagnurus paluster TaxID=117069 RepID=A0A9P7FSZ1_9AGAR|nr:hypothetical protein H0H81_002583 [Sphagnurus paluster]
MSTAYDPSVGPPAPISFKEESTIGRTNAKARFDAKTQIYIDYQSSPHHTPSPQISTPSRAPNTPIVPSSQPRVDGISTPPIRPRGKAQSSLQVKSATAMVNAGPLSSHPNNSTSSRAITARSRSASYSEAQKMNDQPPSPISPSTPTPMRPASPTYSLSALSDDQDMIVPTPIEHAANLLREAISAANRETAALAFESTIAILEHILHRDHKGEIHINHLFHRNAGEDAAAAFASIIEAITPLLSKMAEFNATLDHSDPKVAKFLHLAGVQPNINKFKDPNDDAILSLQNEVQQLKSLLTEKDNQIGSLAAQNGALQSEIKKLGKKPAAPGEPTSPALTDPALRQILSTISNMQKEITELKNPKLTKSLGASIHAPNPIPPHPNPNTPAPRAPAPQVWVPDHTMRLKGEFINANFPGGVPHPLVTSTQYPKGHPSCYEPIPPPANTRIGTSVLPKFPPEVTSAQGGKTKGKGKGKGKATLGPSPSQAESSNAARSAPPPPPPSFFEDLYPMPASWDEEVEYATTQGTANILADLPPAHHNPPPPTSYINPPAAPTFTSKAKAAASLPQPTAPNQPKGKAVSRPKTKVVNARNDVRYQLIFKDKSRVTDVNNRPTTFELVAAFNSALKERIPAELAKDHPSLKGPLGVVSRANWSASNNVAVWLHEAVTHVTFPGLSNIMVTAAQTLNITGSSIPEFKRFSPTCQIETQVPIWNFATNTPYTPAELHQALTDIGVFQDVNLIQKQPGKSPLRITPPKGAEFHKRYIAKVTFVIDNGNGTPYNTIMARSFRFNGQLCHFAKSISNIKALQCSNCWRLGHLSNHCTAKQPVCGDCGLPMLPGEDHNHEKDMALDNTPDSTLITTPPPAFARSCLNCRTAKKDPNTLDHHPSSLDCPILQEANNKARKAASPAAYRPRHR